jgi:hypothetical protein
MTLSQVTNREKDPITSNFCFRFDVVNQELQIRFTREWRVKGEGLVYWGVIPEKFYGVIQPAKESGWKIPTNEESAWWGAKEGFSWEGKESSETSEK